MEKEFLDVFRNLEVGEELRALLKEVAVTKIAVNPPKDRIRIYIRSRQWIHKKYVHGICLRKRNYSIPEHIKDQNAVIFKLQSHGRLVRLKK